MTTATMPGRLGIRLLIAAVAVGLVALLTLLPQRIIGPARYLFMRGVDAVAEPLLVVMPYGSAEQVLNTLMFVPLGMAVAMLLSRHGWPLAILAGFVLSATVEYAQVSVPGRVPDPADIFWNTLGGAIGVAMVTPIRYAVAAGRRSARSRRTRASRA